MKLVKHQITEKLLRAATYRGESLDVYEGEQDACVCVCVCVFGVLRGSNKLTLANGL
jgi:hypothetical protein